MTTKEEFHLVQAVYQSDPISKIPLEKVVELAAEWRAYIGIPNNDIAEELTLAAKFMLMNYGHLTEAEIRMAYNLAIMRKLADVEFRGFFSPDYISRVLASFMHYRKITMADSIRRFQVYQLDTESKKNTPSPEVQCENMRATIKDFHNQFLEHGVFNDPLNIAYNFFRKHNMMVVSQGVIDEATKYGKKVVADKKLTRIIDNENEFKIHARNFCVQEFFKNVDIDVLLNNIKPELFVS